MTEEKKNTEIKAGAEPDNKDAKADPSNAADKDGKKPDSSTEGEPWHKDPRFKQDLGLLKTAKSLMEKNNLESVEDLVDLIESGKKIKGKQVDLERIDEITAKAAKLDKYEAYWAEQEKKRQREEEDPRERAERLEKQLEAKERQEQIREAQRRETEKAQAAVNAYERDVSGQIKDMEIPKEQQGFVLKFFGVGNECNDIDITDRKAVKRLIDKGIKEKEAYDQAVIKAYLEGKSNVPPVSSTGSSTAPEEKQIKTLKDARKAMFDLVTKRGGG